MLKTRSLLMLLAIPAALVSLTLVGSAHAQGPDCGFCNEWYDEDLEEDVHSFGFEGALFECDGPGSAGCHYFSPYYGLCSDYHDPGSPCQVEPEAIEALLASVASNDAAGLVAVVSEHSSRILVNDQTGSIDVLSCDGAEQRTLPLADPLLQEVKRMMSGETHGDS